MIILRAHRGWTYTLEYWTDELTLPDSWMTQIKWSVFDPKDKEIQRGDAATLSSATEHSKKAIDWRATPYTGDA